MILMLVVVSCSLAVFRQSFIYGFLRVVTALILRTASDQKEACTYDCKKQGIIELS